MNPNFENPFRPTNKRATKRLFEAEQKERRLNPKPKTSRKLREIENGIQEQKKLVKYGPFEILNPQVQFLKQIEKLIPQEVIAREKKTAQEILYKEMDVDVDGNIVNLNFENLDLPFLPALPEFLKHLNCKENKLSSLPPLPSALIELNCEKNSLVSLPELPDSLQELYCDSNTLSSLPPLPPALSVLWCDNNKLSSLPPLPSALTWLWCADNKLTSLPELPDSLQYLVCFRNKISRQGKKKIMGHKNSKNFYT